MPGYWWECEKCAATSTFQEVCKTRGIYGFIWDVLRPSWDQTLLVQKCPRCTEMSARIAYKFPRKKQEELLFRVVHVVGLDWGIGFLPMMWAAYCVGDPNTLKYDFKFLTKGNIRGLSRPPIFTQEDLRELFALYCAKTGLASFP